jgi:hypothetical protein
MYDYLADLHQSLSIIPENNNNNNEQQMKITDGSTSFFHSPYDNNHRDEQQRYSNRSILNCNCSRTISGENIHQIKNRNRQQQHRLCSLS